MTLLHGIPANVVTATLGVWALLILATIVVGVLRWRNPGTRYADLARRTESWWW